MNRDDHLSVGRVAERAGITVRTLHHWDEIGLVSPARSSESGYRLYGSEEVERVEKVLTLRQLGFGLSEIGQLLEEGGWSRVRVLRARLDALDREIEEQRGVRERLAGLVEAVEGGGAVGSGDVLELISEMERIRSHYTAEQLEAMAARSQEIGEEEIARVENRWPEVIAELEDHVRRKTPAADPAVQELAREWRGLIDAFTGGDSAVEENLRAVWSGSPGMAEGMGISPGMVALVSEALGAVMPAQVDSREDQAPASDSGESANV